MADAEKMFSKVFLEKTGNAFGSKFVEKEGKYVLLEVDPEKVVPSSPAKAASPVKPSSPVAPSPPPAKAKAKSSPEEMDFDFEAEVVAKPQKTDVPDERVMGLVKMVFDRQSMERLLTSFSFNLEKASGVLVSVWFPHNFLKSPLGKLKKSTLLQGYSKLKELDAAIEKGVPNSELEKLSNSYYSLIPHK